MSKEITISTDWHFGKSNGKFDHIILEGIYQQCTHAIDNQIDIMINLGDIIDTKQTLLTSTLNYLAKAMIKVNETFKKTYIIVGNHDMSKKNYDTESHNLNILKGYPNIEIIDSPQTINIYNRSIYMLPYFPHTLLKTHIFAPADYMMGHIEVQGFMLNQFMKAEEGVNMNAITNLYKHVFLGHFHKRQNKRTISYIGNLCRFFYGEDDEERGWTLVDLEKNEFEFVEYYHPRMYKFKISTLMQEEDLSEIFNPGDNLKLVIDTQLKYSELEEFKSKLILDYKINDLILDDQFYAFDIDEDEEDDENVENSLTSDSSYMEYLLSEITKNTKLIITDSAMDYLKEKSNDYQE